MKVSDAQTKLFDEYQREYERKLEGIICEFQDNVIELAKQEINHHEFFDQLANSQGWDGFPDNCTVGLIDERGKVYPVLRTQLNEIFNFRKDAPRKTAESQAESQPC